MTMGLLLGWLVVMAAASGPVPGGPDGRKAALAERASQSMDRNPDAVLVCEYGSDWEESGDLYDVMITSCTVVAVQKGQLKPGQKIRVRRMIEKPGKERISAKEKESMGDLRFIFFDAREGWIDTGDGCPWDEVVAAALEKKVEERKRQGPKDK